MNSEKNGDDQRPGIERMAEAMRKAMARKGMNQLDLAKHSGVHETTISRAMNGRLNVRIGTIEKLCRALDLKIAFVYKKRGGHSHVAKTLCEVFLQESKAADAKPASSEESTDEGSTNESGGFKTWNEVGF